VVPVLAVMVALAAGSRMAALMVVVVGMMRRR